MTYFSRVLQARPASVFSLTIADAGRDIPADAGMSVVSERGDLPIGRGDRIFKLDPDGSLIFQIIGSNFPNWNGTTQKRLVEISGNQLKYITPATSIGGSAVSILTRAKYQRPVHRLSFGRRGGRRGGEKQRGPVVRRLHAAGQCQRRCPQTGGLVGGTGTGKTHLAIAIARSCIRSGVRGR
jgi:hypothetical protein